MKKKSIMLLIVMIAIGFATVSTTIILNGKVGIGTNQDNYIDGVVFDSDSLTSSEGTTVNLSESGRTITFTTQNMKSIGEEAKVNFKIKNYSQYNATLEDPAISCYFVNDHTVDTKSESTSTTHEYMQLIPGEELNGATITAGGGLSAESSVTVKQIKSYIEDGTTTAKFQCEINSSASDSKSSNSDTPGTEPPVTPLNNYELIDTNSSGTADIGEEIVIGDQYFYVISHSEGIINALSKYNLNVGPNRNLDATEGIQHETVRGFITEGTTYGNVAFSNNKGWAYADNNQIDINLYDGPVKDALYGTNGYKNYIKQTIPEVTVRLISKEEIETLVNEGNAFSVDGESIKDKIDAKGYSWLYNTTYWIGNAASSVDTKVWFMYSTGDIYNNLFSDDQGIGVRPVITIPE